MKSIAYYKQESYAASAVCIIAAVIICIVTVVAGAISEKFSYSAPLLIFCLLLVAYGIYSFKRSNDCRKKFAEAKANGTAYSGKVVSVQRKNTSQPVPEEVKFEVEYSGDSTYETVRFVTPALNFTPDEDDVFTCTVYEYNGETYAYDFELENSDDDDEDDGDDEA